MKKPVAVSVNLHAWQTLESGDIEYCDAARTVPDGWCVYTRTDFDNEGISGPFDISEERDFSNYEEARKHGEKRASLLGVPLQEY